MLGMVGEWVGFSKNVSNVLFLSFFAETVSWMDWTPDLLEMEPVGEFGIWCGVGFSKNVSNVLFLSFFAETVSWID